MAAVAMAVEGVTAVGLGEVCVERGPSVILVAYGLGSCVGVALYDPVTMVGGMAHVVLPDSNLASNKNNAVRFADVGIPALVERAVSRGAIRSRLTAKIAGGATMLRVPGSDSMLQIGQRNVQAVKTALERSGIPIFGDDTGGRVGRTMQLFLSDGKVTVRAFGMGSREL